MSDWLKVALLSSATFLWLAGGTGTPPFGKLWRRLIWPLVAAFILHLHGVNAWQIGGVFLSLVTVTSLGYGDTKSWPDRIGVFLSYALPSFVLGLHLWWLRLLITGGGCTAQFWLSRRIGKYDHKLFESYCGFAQAATLILAT